MKKTKIVVIGGGTGSVAVLTGLKQYSDLDLSVIVTMMDDGGSNKVVRDDFGLLPLSDLRKSIIAMAGKGNGIFRQLFTYRFDKGQGLSGHTLGNLIMMALSDITGSEKDAVQSASEIFNAVGKIIPVTYDLVQLCAKYANGETVIGEHHIDAPDEPRNYRLSKLFLKPAAKANPDAVKTIKQANYVIIGPGDLYTSVLSNVVVDGIPEAIQQTKAKVIFINNLMTENGETRGMKSTDMVSEISKYCGRQPDYVLQNNAKYNPKILNRYKKSGEVPISDDLKDTDQTKIIRDDIVSSQEISVEKGDILQRSLIRHDSVKLARALYKLMFY